VLNATEDSTQPVILVSYAQEQVAGSVITLKTADGDALLEYTSRNAYMLTGFTSPSLQPGETYTLFIDGEKKTDITLNGTVTSLSDDGGAYNGGRGGERGNRGGEMPPDEVPPGREPRFGGERPGANAPPAEN
jgi:hypothetical protein